MKYELMLKILDLKLDVITAFLLSGATASQVHPVSDAFSKALNKMDVYYLIDVGDCIHNFMISKNYSSIVRDTFYNKYDIDNRLSELGREITQRTIIEDDHD